MWDPAIFGHTILGQPQRFNQLFQQDLTGCGKLYFSNSRSMVIDNLHFVGFAVAPHEADPPLLIDPNGAALLGRL